MQSIAASADWSDPRKAYCVRSLVPTERSQGSSPADWQGWRPSVSIIHQLNALGDAHFLGQPIKHRTRGGDFDIDHPGSIDLHRSGFTRIALVVQRAALRLDAAQMSAGFSSSGIGMYGSDLSAPTSSVRMMTLGFPSRRSLPDMPPVVRLPSARSRSSSSVRSRPTLSAPSDRFGRIDCVGDVRRNFNTVGGLRLLVSLRHHLRTHGQLPLDTGLGRGDTFRCPGDIEQAAISVHDHGQSVASARAVPTATSVGSPAHGREWRCESPALWR